MKDNTDVILYALAGIAIGAVAVYIYLTQTNMTKITDLTRDASGRIISIVEKKV